MTMKLPPIAVVGPTASGKSALSLDLAERYGGEVVNVDSMPPYSCMEATLTTSPP